MNFLNKVKINQSYISNIQALKNVGGTIYALSENFISFENLKFIKILSGSSGGFAHLTFKNKFFIENSLFVNVKSETYGGLLTIEGNNFVKILRNNFSNIEANSDGGLLRILDNNQIKLDLCNFEKINSINNGGLISSKNSNFIEILYANIKIISNLFGKGGLIEVFNKNKIFIGNSILNSIQSNLAGGLIFLKISNEITLFNSKFLNISVISKDSGGVFLINDKNNYLKIMQCNFSNFSSFNGEFLKGTNLNEFVINSSILEIIYLKKSFIDITNKGRLILIKSIIIIKNNSLIASFLLLEVQSHIFSIKQLFKNFIFTF